VLAWQNGRSIPFCLDFFVTFFIKKKSKEGMFNRVMLLSADFGRRKVQPNIQIFRPPGLGPATLACRHEASQKIGFTRPGIPVLHFLYLPLPGLLQRSTS